MADLIVSKAAQTDIVDIQLYGITTFGLKVSDHYSAGLKAAMARLTEFPLLAAERSELDRPVRVLPYGSHIVVYVLDKDVVRILRVRHGSEDWHDDPAGGYSGDEA